MPPSMAGRAGGLPLEPERWQRNGPEPGLGGCPLFQPGHPRVDQLLLVTPEGDEDDVPLAGQSGRQRHLASAEVTGRQRRERYPFIIWGYAGTPAGGARRQGGRADGDPVTSRVPAGAGGHRGSRSGSGLRVGEVEVPHALEGGPGPELLHGAVGGEWVGAVLTGLGVTITGRCSPISCLAQLRRDAAVPDDDSGAQGGHGSPAAPEQLLALAAAAQLCRQGVGAVQPSRPR
jgi:hypothetical protein